MMFKTVRVRLIPTLEQVLFLEEVSYNYTRQLIEISQCFSDNQEPQVYLLRINKIPFNSKYLLFNDIRKKSQKKVINNEVVQYCLWNSKNAKVSLNEKTISLQSSNRFVYVEICLHINRYKLQLLKKGKICKVKTHCLDNQWYMDILLQFPE